MTGKVQGQQYFLRDVRFHVSGMEECPQGAVSVKNGKVFTEAGRCTGCETCIDICVNNAREICGKTYGIQELQKKLRNYINYPVYIGG